MRCLIWFACALGACGVIFGAETTPTNLYVSVYGAGDLSGRDWDNATNNLTGAYAVCAAHPGGGTVFLAGGIYRSTGWSATDGNFTEDAAIVPASNVAIVGNNDPAFPTILTGDRDLNDKWAVGSANQWVDGVLVEPGETVWTYPSPQGTNDKQLFSSSVGTENCRFENLTIHGFKEYGCYLENATNVVYENCRFISIGVNGTHEGARPLELSDAPAALTNCSFVACRNGIYFSSSVETTLTVVGCLFRACYMGGALSYCTLLYPQKYVHLVVRDTTFRYNYSGQICAIRGDSLNYPASIVDTAIEHCESGSALCKVVSGGSFDGCLFVSNKVTGGSAAITSNYACTLRNCYFGYNSATVTKTAGSGARASFQRNAGLFAIAREGCLSGLQRGS